MIASADFQIKPISQTRINEVNLENVPFGKYFTDHMLVADYEGGEWKQVQIVPYQSLTLSPALASLHYGQAIFEGIKAYKNAQGEAFIFRPADNYRRFNVSAERMEMPTVRRRFSWKA